MADCDLSGYAQAYTRKVFGAYLQSKGFVSYKNQGFSWYRVVNNEVIQTLYFHTRQNYIPVCMEIGYGIHPLYVSPVYPAGVFYRDPPVNFEIFSTDFIMKVQPNVTNMVYSPEIQVICPNDEFKGLDVIMAIVEKMDELHSGKQVYQMHKASYEGKGYRAASTDFFDEVIYNNDSTLFEPCLEMIEERLLRWGKDPKPSTRTTLMLNQLQLQKKTIETGNRDELMEVLAKRKEKNVKDLRRKVGIAVTPINR